MDAWDRLVEYFANPMMYKTDTKGEWAVYGVRFHCLLNTPRYLVVITTRDLRLAGTGVPLGELRHWVSLQTRTIKATDTSTLGSSLAAYPGFVHSPRRFPALANAAIVLQDKDHRESRYDCAGLGLRVTLLHPSAHEDPGYRAEGTLLSALETYQTMLTRL